VVVVSDAFDWPDPVAVQNAVNRAHEDVRAALSGAFPVRVVAGVVRVPDVAAEHRSHYAAGVVVDGCPICPGNAYDGTHSADGYRLDACRSCGAPIVWATTPDGKSMPVDGPLTHGGNVVLSIDDHGKVSAVVLDQESLFGDGPRHLSHFATCLDAESWRTRRTKS
jgi:hypothetical protein